MNGMAASDKIFKILDIENKHQGKEMLKQDLLNIEFSHLSFQYDKRPILKDISFKIQAGQFIGIVGESGSGKSTIAKLVMGNYQHYDGSLLIQNQERYDIADTSFLKRVMYITHEPMIFKGTLRDNLDFYHQYRDEELYLALKKVSLNQYFKQLEGLDTLILEAGSNLSGGQRPVSYTHLIGSVILKTYGDDIKFKAKAYAAAGSDARMSGCEMPVIINSGSCLLYTS